VKVVHVEAGRHLFGGARQVLYLLEGLQARRVDSVLVCPRGSAVAAGAREVGIEVAEIGPNGDLDLRFVGRLRELLANVRPDLVHAHSRRGADWLGGIAAWSSGIPAVVSRRVDNPERAWLARRKYALYDRVVTISEGIAEVVRATGVAHDRVVCVPSAVAPAEAQRDRAAFAAEFGVPEDVCVLGVVAQMIERKGHRDLLAALPAIRAAVPGVRVLFFGRGPLESALRREVAAAGLGDIVQFAGFRSDLSGWLANLDLLVHPAHMEGLGVALLEASAAGVAIVAARAGGIPEAVADGANGRLVEPGDTDALARRVIELAQDPDERARLGAGGRRRVAERFSVDAMVDGNLAVYRAVLAERGVSGATDGHG